MTGSPDRPLLFLDVDGPLIPFGGQATPTFDVLPGGETSANPLLARINPEHGSRLAALPCELVWATSWMTDANESISPRLGLPELPVAISPEAADDEPTDSVHWKTRTLVDWAAGRRSSGSTIRSPAPTESGLPPIASARRCCTGSTRATASPSWTLRSSTTG